jgi:imidazolonepropionase-like amidohydrolase
MKINCSVLVATWMFSVSAGAAPKPDTPIALTHVTIVDVRAGRSASDMTVIIDGERIAAIGDSSRTRPPPAARVIDARGKFIIPGLWDMHTHLFVEPHLQADLNLLIANGITGVRDTGGEWRYFDPYIHELRQGRRPAGLETAPRIVAAGKIIDGSPPYSEDMISVATAAQGREAVRTVQEHGADFIKIYSYMDRVAFFAIADEARKRGLMLAGHVPYAVSVGDASDAGQKSLEHADGILLAASTEEQTIREQILKDAPHLRANELQKFELYYIYGHYRPMRTYSDAKAAALFARFVRNGTWACPTLIAQKGALPQDEEPVMAEVAARYESAATIQSWRKFLADIQWPGEEARQVTEVYHRLITLVGDMSRAGVGILAGTDEGVPFVLPGFSLHRELELLVSAGLTPLQALQTATLNPARFLGRERDLGTIEAGKLADAVLLDADPLVDIRNTSKIDAVLAGGAYLSRSALDGVLAGVAAQAAGTY